MANASAVDPFGAIDTPEQGGVASGTSFVNWGWALTPQPNAIPTNGQTISVYVDGDFVGHPTYNVYREDIASLFPGYANSNGAAGYLHLNTTLYENGVHTIQWVVTDNAGNTEGIGSRFFTIDNEDGPQVSDPMVVDEDWDGFPDETDNCPAVHNPDQEDGDGDEAGAACDCDDTNPEVYPGREEIPGNGIDDDCDGLVDEPAGACFLKVLR